MRRRRSVRARPGKGKRSPMHGHRPMNHEVPSGRRAGTAAGAAMHARDTHRLTGRSITLARWLRSSGLSCRRGRRSQTDRGSSLSVSQPRPAESTYAADRVAFTVASDASVRSFVRSLRRGRGRTDQTPQKSYADRGVGAHRTVALQVLGARRRARRPL